MTTANWAAPAAALLGLCLFGLPDDPKKDPPNKKITIEGVVFDSDRKPLLGVDVGVYVAGKKDSVMGGKIADKEGKYSFKVEVSDSFNIAFTKSGYRPCVMKQLKEGEDHRISLILYRRGEAFPASAAHAYLQSVDRLVFLAIALEKGKRNDFLKQFPDAPLFFLDERLNFSEAPSIDIKIMLETEKDEILKRLQRLRKDRSE